MEKSKMDIWGILLLTAFFICLSVAGYLAYKSIDYTVLTRLENQKLTLPTEAPFHPATQSAQTTKP